MPTHAPPTHVLDDYYLAITLIITVAYQLIGFAIAFTLKFDKLTDFWGGSNFAMLAIITLSMSGTTNARQIVTSIFLIVWASRLAGFLLFRILKTGKDDRFDDKRGSFFKFLGFWVFQMFWVWTVSMPVTILNSPNVLQYRQPSFGKATDIIGIIFWVIAFFTEAISDVQKYRFKQSERGQQPGAVCNVGFFKYSRHPNYFGEIMIQVCKCSSCLSDTLIQQLLTISSDLHDSRNSCELPHCPIFLRSIRRSLRLHGRLDILDRPANVCLRLTPSGASRRQEAL